MGCLQINHWQKSWESSGFLHCRQCCVSGQNAGCQNISCTGQKNRQAKTIHPKVFFLKVYGTPDFPGIWDLYDAFAWDGQPEAAPIRQEDYQQILRKSHQRDPYLVEILSAPAEKIISSMDSRGTSINGCSNSWWMSSAMAIFIRERSDISPLCSNCFKDPKLTPDFSLNFFCESFLRFRI